MTFPIAYPIVWQRMVLLNLWQRLALGQQRDYIVK